MIPYRRAIERILADPMTDETHAHPRLGGLRLRKVVERCSCLPCKLA